MFFYIFLYFWHDADIFFYIIRKSNVIDETAREEVGSRAARRDTDAGKKARRSHGAVRKSTQSPVTVEAQQRRDVLRRIRTEDLLQRLNGEAADAASVWESLSFDMDHAGNVRAVKRPTLTLKESVESLRRAADLLTHETALWW